MKIGKKMGLVSTVLASFFTLSCATPRINIKTVPPSLERKIIQYVEQKAVPGKQFLLDSVKENNITILGETHARIHFRKYLRDSVESIVREEVFLKESVHELKSAGLNYLAVELSETDRPFIEKYIKTGIKDEDFKEMEEDFPWGKKAFYSWIDMVGAAMDEGIKIAYIDTPEKIEYEEGGDYRDAYMARKVKDIMSKDKDAKVLIHIGVFHAVEDELTSYAKCSIDSPKSLARILSKEFDCYSILAEPFFIIMTLPQELYRTNKAIGFDVDESPVADLEGERGFKRYGDAFDGVLIFPKENQPSWSEDTGSTR